MKEFEKCVMRDLTILLGQDQTDLACPLRKPGTVCEFRQRAPQQRLCNDSPQNQSGLHLRPGKGRAF